MKLAPVRLTIGQVMTLVAIVAVILGLFAASRDDPGLVAFRLLLGLVVVVPVHFAIEGNRRDSLGIDTEREAHESVKPDPFSTFPPRAPARQRSASQDFVSRLSRLAAGGAIGSAPPRVLRDISHDRHSR